jgi:acyl-CoA dehydrogenase
VLKELHALESGNVSGFDRNFWKHVGHVVRNAFRFVVLSLTRGLFVIPPVFGRTSHYYQKLSWASAQFALFADIALGTMGGSLKRKEKITGRYADILSWMYLGTAVLRRYEAEGRRKEDLPFVHWSMQYAFAQMQEAFEGLFSNMGVAYKPVYCWSIMCSLGQMPSDDLGAEVAQLILQPSEQRDRLTKGIYIPKDENEALGRLEKAFEAIHAAQPITKRMMAAVKEGKLAKGNPEKLVKQAVELNVITMKEAEVLVTAEKYRRDAIQVDDFTLNEYSRRVVQ